ncbi:unnamed protein product [Dovyalis caffra]|uniref:Protein PHLOEM PROTEIN 2-LIKE A9-like n=1 Tax=Dovyalis caffra TaxID=77055 RepID=A0AAV1RMP3_9ROSI|nr:unnamed protein product [Dovyalis caffra]
MSSSNKPHYEADPDEVKYEKENNRWTFNPRGFSIIWGKDKRYWNLPEENHPEKPAELVQVSWLELTGKTKEALPVGKYEIKFEVSLEQGAFGWNNCPVFMMAKIGKTGKYKWIKINIADLGPDKKLVPPDFQIEVDRGSEDRKLYFGLYEVWSGKWKGGLRIHKATVQKVS